MIEFLHLSIRNFRSWARLDIDLQNQGVVCLRGFTGAGKSSIFSALFWGLYGKLPEDTRADEVRKSKKPTAVRITLRREDQEYTITRYRGHREYKNKVFFRGVGIPLVVEDSYVKTVQSLINGFLGVTETIFLTTTYFAQRNFHHFHSLTDTQKKAFIESITYGSLFEACENITREKVRRDEREIDRLEGQIQGLEESIKNIQVYSQEQKHQEKKDRIDLRKKIQEIDTHIEKLHRILAQYVDFVEQYYELSDKIETLEDKKISLQEDIQRYKNNKEECPRCGLIMPDNLRKERIHETQQSIDKLDIRYSTLIREFPEIKAGYDKYKSTTQWIEAKERDKTVLQSQLDARRNRQTHIDNTEELRRKCQDITDEIHSLKKALAYVSFWIKGFSFQGLRAYVLINAIRYLSSQTEIYLRRVMGEKIDFAMLIENNKLVTECNGRSYASLSGGERQAVDLCTGLAMRDLAEQYNKSKFNLLILDEPHEGLDKNLTVIAQALLMECAKPSTFLITHQGFNGKFAKVYDVSKRNGKSCMRKVY